MPQTSDKRHISVLQAPPCHLCMGSQELVLFLSEARKGRYQVSPFLSEPGALRLPLFLVCSLRDRCPFLTGLELLVRARQTRVAFWCWDGQMLPHFSCTQNHLRVSQVPSLRLGSFEGLRPKRANARKAFEAVPGSWWVLNPQCTVLVIAFRPALNSPDHEL